MFAACVQQNAPEVRNTLRAPAYPLVTIDPYTSAWSVADNLYDVPVKHWTGSDFPLIGVISVDGVCYRFMGAEGKVYQSVAPMASEHPWEAAYTTDKPAANWYTPEFNDSKWKSGKGAFGNPHSVGVTTPWEEPLKDIWIRRTVKLTEADLSRPLRLSFSNDDDLTVYINGVEALSAECCNEGRTKSISDDALKALKEGDNLIAAYCHNSVGPGLVDVGISSEVEIANNFEQTAVQTLADVQATQTHYAFECGGVALQLTFTAPLLMDNLELVSRPVNYLTYRAASADGKKHSVKMYFEASPAWAVDKYYQISDASKDSKNGLTYLKTGSTTQHILRKKGDNVRIDWGYFYIAGEDKPEYEYLTGAPIMLRSVFAGTAPETIERSNHEHLAVIHDLGTVGSSKGGKIMLGYDDIYSLQYFGENLRPYWNSDGSKTIYDAFEAANNEYNDLMKKCAAFDNALMRKATEAGGSEYAELCALVYRQAIAAHKLAKAPNGDLLFLSKENFSNGSIGTVDITYPSAPLFLLYNPELCKGLLNHIFYYSESGKWTKPFAAHDVGTYPQANGQTYGGDMPVEESGNMLITTAAVAQAEGNAEYAAKHWETLTVWTNYLVENGLDPENQLCTDDFAGHFAHNVNLSVKAILGIASYGKLAAMLGKTDLAKEYTDKARVMAQEWKKMAADSDHYRLTFDQTGTWSQKYNLVWDKLLRLNVFDSDIATTETAYYLNKQNRYGLPLDSRETYTKADWIIWTATMAGDKPTFEKFIAPLRLFANETVSRVPLTDWYWTDKPEQRGFQARSVVGGFYIKMLEEKFSK
jgi:hypothetical protein